MFLALLSKPRLRKAGTWPTWNPPDLLQHKFISLCSDVKAKQENWNLCIIYISTEYYTFSSITDTRSGVYYQNWSKQVQERMDQITKQIGELHPKNEDKQDLSVFLGKVDIHILEFRVSSFKFQHLLKCTSFIITSWISNEEAIATSINKNSFLCATFSQNPWQDRWSCREISITTIKGNTTMSAVITSWESLTKWQTITFITNSSDELPWLPTEFISSQQWV